MRGVWGWCCLVVLLTLSLGLSSEVSEIVDPIDDTVVLLQERAPITADEETEAYARAKTGAAKADQSRKASQAAEDAAQLAEQKADESEEKAQTDEGVRRDVKWKCNEASVNLARSESSISDFGNQLKEAETTVEGMKKRQASDVAAAQVAATKATAEYEKYDKALQEVKDGAQKAKGAAAEVVSEARRKFKVAQQGLSVQETQEDAIRRESEAKQLALRQVENEQAETMKTTVEKLAASDQKLEEVKRLANEGIADSQSKASLAEDAKQSQIARGKENVASAKSAHKTAIEAEQEAGRRLIELHADAEKIRP